MKSYFVKTPDIVQKLFSNYQWKVSTNQKEIYLTFDDGPIPEITPWVLQQLAQFQAKATFFCVGDNITKFPEIYDAVLQEKHGIGNHTFHHLNGWKTNSSYYVEDMDTCGFEIEKQQTPNTATNHLFFRPPYGKITPSQTKKILQKGYKIIFWDVLSGDFDQSLSKETCLENVIKNTQKGSIIVFHDSEKAFKNLEYVLPRFLEYFSKQGYVFKSL